MKGCIRKLNLVSLLVFMIFCFTGCGNNNQSVVKESGEEIVEKVKQKMEGINKCKVDLSLVTSSDNDELCSEGALSINYIKDDNNDIKASMQANLKNKKMNFTASAIKESDYLYFLITPNTEAQCLKFKLKFDSSKLIESLEKMQDSLKGGQGNLEKMQDDLGKAQDYYNDAIKNCKVEFVDGEYVLSGNVDYHENGNEFAVSVTCKISSDYNISSIEAKANGKSSDGKESGMEIKATFSYDDVNVLEVDNPSDYRCINEMLGLPLNNS